ncbi:flavodoxin family protein [Caulobacter vibrioides]|uniref:Flavodoxin-like fold domain-containing protein n=2 Tax=Caulobacter vibrioides TaxID=155892 RepID=Q9ABF1_CAUVC|nr:NAD(P)H-dependent oxidoreductase [Caulobacter vibrioides]YP_002515654.1 NAD(P)H-quinone reductase [Caulobacter vibrioides NA1000]AAK22264.1 hypothetical protein CC_0277 [Caulobacter vibrioides CB15]ACL93746.1 NAD(P)H-quinone reductase [Caulobacter vibrioides NA1000]ATC27109.1 flavodoxin family protein [Caulobacter vibrioides]AZH11494.1 flavodoxin family protein [Caulobacter vibrioides]QXZ52370.1 NAD(P)H-dependent oxidoreductase [Caulobacter vibrioides]
MTTPSRRILILVGHPDPAPERFCRALAEAYAQGAMEGGHEVRRADIGSMDIALLESQAAFQVDDAPQSIRDLRADIVWAEHLVLVFPLWLGGAPAKLKAALEQVCRGGFGFEVGPRGWSSKLAGRSARMVLTMGMPSAIFRLVFGSHGLKAVTQGIFMLAGVKPRRASIIGGVEAIGAGGRSRWLKRMGHLGEAAR